MRNKIALQILLHWGYRNVTIGDLDGRNFEAEFAENRHKSWYRPRDRSYKTLEAVKHAYRLADIALECIGDK